MKTKNMLAVGAAALAVMTAGVASAGLITISSGALSDVTGWNSPTGNAITDDNTKVNPSGTLVYAWNVNGDAAHTVGGISFSNTQPTDVTLGGIAGSTANLAGNMGFYEDGSDVEAMMADFSYGNMSVTITVTLGGLTVGQEYRAQFLQQRANSANNNPTSYAYFGDTSGTNGGAYNTYTPAYTEAVFTADGTSQVFTFAPNSGGRATMNALALTAIPEPASGLTLFAGAMGLVLLRRKIHG